jgi:hypothetical protein
VTAVSSPGWKADNPLRAGKPAEKAAIGVALAAYAFLLAYQIPRHEPWADEAQAWELAQSLSLRSLFGTYIHYEGSPGLWHALLWALSRFHVSYTGMHWFAAGIAFAGMVLLTINAPFPLILRLALPFTYFFAFQYSIVARSYVLFPPLLFALACYWPHRLARPLPAILLIGMLGNVSAHGFLVALGLAFILAIELWRTPQAKRAPGKIWCASAVLMAAMLGFAAWSVFPAPDAGWLVVAKHAGLNVPSAATANQQSQPNPQTQPHSSRWKVGARIAYQYAHDLGHGLADKYHIGVIVWLLLIWGWSRNGLLRYCLPVLFLWVLFGPFPSQFYHAGLLWVLFLFLWWVTWPEQVRSQPVIAPWETSRTALLLGVAMCIAIQLIWAFSAVRYDIFHPYSPNRDGASVLREYLDRGQKVDVAVPANSGTKKLGEFFITGLEPYFAAEPINNMSYRFWFWGWEGDMRSRYLLDTENRSVVAVVEETNEDQRYKIEETRLGSKGYRRAKVICGQTYYPDAKNSLDSSSSAVCHAFYEPQ